MARDIREILRSENNLSKDKMPAGHEARFLEKLDAMNQAEESNSSKTYNGFYFLRIAAAVIIFLGLGYGAYTFFNGDAVTETIVQVEEDKEENKDDELKTLGDVSPNLKKVEDYYIANINLELANVDITEDNKEFIDGYILKLEELNKEYNRLSKELTESGPNELTISALIDNLKLRLNLLYRLKEQLKELESPESDQILS